MLHVEKPPGGGVRRYVSAVRLLLLQCL